MTETSESMGERLSRGSIGAFEARNPGAVDGEHVPIEALRVDDVIRYCEVRCTVLALPVTVPDLFGRPNWSAQCRREDTGAEGAVRWGKGDNVSVWRFW